MFKALHTSVLSLGLIAFTGGLACAEPISTDPADRTIRPGDKIEWSVPNPHFLRVGAAGLTPIADVDKILTFTPPLTVAGGVGNSASGGTVVGTVKDNADTQGVAQFVFTCGQHPTAMKSLPFPVAAKDARTPATRTLKIKAVTVNGEHHWILEKVGGDVQVDVD
jgi:hypothetical protein